LVFTEDLFGVYDETLLGYVFMDLFEAGIPVENMGLVSPGNFFRRNGHRF
jgi:hypothetical protein